MPSLNDYDKNDGDSGGLDDGYTPAQSAAVGSATGAPKQATPTKQQADSFVPWSSFVNANKDVSDREAGKLQSQVQGDVSKAQGDLSTDVSGFNSGVAGNYQQPAAPAAPQQPKTSKPSSQQSAPVGGSATPQPAGTTAATAPTQRAPVQQYAPGAQYTGTRTALDGGNTHALPPAQKRAPVATLDTSQPGTPPNVAAHAPTSPQQPSNPWAAFLGPQSMQATTPPQTPGAQALMSGARSKTLTPGAVAGNPTGGPDLETSAGPQAWSQLLGDTQRAQQEANALGSEAGVQSLLQQSQSSPMQNTAFDAALINGQGAPGFEKLAQQYGGEQLQQGIVGAEQKSQDAWKQLQGDISTRQAFDAAGKTAPAAPAVTSQQALPETPGAAPTPDMSGWSAIDDQAYAADAAVGNQTAQQNNGEVEVAFGGSNTGLGNANHKPDENAPWGQGINVASGKNGPDYSDWWGGATDTPVGDKSIPAAVWYALAMMTTAERAKWWKHNHPGS